MTRAAQPNNIKRMLLLVTQMMMAVWLAGLAAIGTALRPHEATFAKRGVDSIAGINMGRVGLLVFPPDLFESFSFGVFPSFGVQAFSVLGPPLRLIVSTLFVVAYSFYLCFSILEIVAAIALALAARMPFTPTLCTFGWCKCHDFGL